MKSVQSQLRNERFRLAWSGTVVHSRQSQEISRMIIDVYDHIWLDQPDWESVPGGGPIPFFRTIQEQVQHNLRVRGS